MGLYFLCLYFLVAGFSAGVLVGLKAAKASQE